MGDDMGHNGLCSSPNSSLILSRQPFVYLNLLWVEAKADLTDSKDMGDNALGVVIVSPLRLIQSCSRCSAAGGD